MKGFIAAALAAVAVACVGAGLYGLAIRPAGAGEMPLPPPQKDVVNYCPKGPLFPCQQYVTTCTTQGSVTTCTTTILVGQEEM